MAEPSPDKAVMNIVGPLITAVIGAAIGWLPGGMTGTVGPPLALLIAAGGAIAGLAFSMMYRRYVGVLGAGGRPKGSPARAAYDRLLGSLSGGSLASRLYADWLTKSLDAVDRFFGDAGLANQTLFPNAFGLSTPAPLWTAPAFDRCLLLALVYPIATVFSMWTVSGHVGPAESALDLRPDLSAWQRGVLATSVGLVAYAFWRAAGAKGWNSQVWSVVAVIFAFAFAVDSAFTGVGSFAVAVSIAGAVAVAIAGVVSFAFNVAVTGVGAVAGVVVLTCVFSIAFAEVFSTAAAFSVADVFSVLGAAAITFAGVFAGAVGVAVAVLNDISFKARRQGIFLSLYLLCMIVCCFGAAYLLSPLESWRTTGAVLLYLGLLTLTNAPFDWASLGLTRALLRRGLELGGWSPYFLAIVDAVLSAGIIALLALTTVVGVQAFDHLAEHGGGAGKRILPLKPLFDGIAANPGAPEYWWAYALLVSTMIPSLINLMIGGASLLRGLPGLPAMLLHFLPVGKAVAPFERQWIAVLLTAQVFVGAFLGVAAQAILAIAVIFYIMPWFGLELLDMARKVAEFDVPMQVMKWF